MDNIKSDKYFIIKAVSDIDLEKKNVVETLERLKS
jgi:hypothetical protein